MLTAIITLLTTVIGFYFGSRSATEGMQTGPASNPAASTDLRAVRRQIDQTFNPLKAAIGAAAAKIDGLQQDPTGAQGRQEALNAIAGPRQEVERRRDQIAGHLRDADAALASLDVAKSPNERRDLEKRVRGALNAAGELLDEARAAQPGYEQRVGGIA